MHDLPGGFLALDDYIADFNTRLETCTALWKLERRQSFVEPDEPSWVALDEGDWAKSLELAEQTREETVEYYAEELRRGRPAHRVRVVELPLTPYLQWELHMLRMQEQGGARPRVVPPERVAGFERVRPVPELLVLEGVVLYDVQYDGNGAALGARVIEDVDVVAACRHEIGELWREAEPLADFFEREVAHLGPPV
ncbi:DUF6879 family protein [Sinosporangium siamense]|uniref:DUF6879 family protein n=1 Tax=Sinosporangium siamense TaxID=1367973 RepID=UPI0035E7C38D